LREHDMKRLTLAATFLLTAAVALAAQPAEGQAVQPDAKPVVSGNTQFALDLYGKLRGQDGNLFP
jgi:hypothetical protein